LGSSFLIEVADSIPFNHWADRKPYGWIWRLARSPKFGLAQKSTPGREWNLDDGRMYIDVINR